jgi:hypothetical protein
VESMHNSESNPYTSTRDLRIRTSEKATKATKENIYSSVLFSTNGLVFITSKFSFVAKM